MKRKIKYRNTFGCVTEKVKNGTPLWNNPQIKPSSLSFSKPLSKKDLELGIKALKGKNMKIIKVITEFEVPSDFNDNEALIQFVTGTMDNAPEPEDIDVALKDVEIGICYID